MALTPEQLAELQRLKQMYAPLVEAQRRRDQADANAQKMGIPLLPPDKKAKGGLETFLEPSVEKRRAYHGTPNNFSYFAESPTYVAFDPKFASDYGLSRTEGVNYHPEETAQGASVMPVHVQVQNPFDYKKRKHVLQLLRKLRQRGQKHFTKEDLHSGSFEILEDPTVFELMKKLGHDAFYVNEGYGDQRKNLGVFDPRKIKSAIGNRGTYDPNNPDITKSTGGEVEDDYRSEHTAPSPEFGAPMHDVTRDMYPKDFYGPNGFRIYADYGEPKDREAYNKVTRVKGKPDEMVYIHRAIPTSVYKEALKKDAPLKHMIRKGDWVAISKDYAKEHGESVLRGDYKIASMRVPAKHVWTNGDSVHEWGYHPVETKATGGSIPSMDVMRLAIGGQGPKNWLKGSVENVIKPLMSKGITEADRAWLEQHGQQNPEALRIGLEAIPRTEAINQWIERNLANYIKKQMATPDDPIRKLAEQGIIHMPPEQMGYGSSQAEGVRKKHGAPRLGQSPEAQAWEDATDVAMHKIPVSLINKKPFIGKSNWEPWMEKADPNTEVFHPTDSMHAHYLGFDHLVDILKEDLAEGRIRPEQLSKVSIEHAVRRAHEYDQEKKRKMAETALKATEGMPVHKDYGDGFKWIELALPKELPEGYSMSPAGTYVDPEGKQSIHHPGYGKLADAMKYEGDTMGHCVKGESYVSGVAKGEKRIFSLRDAKNEPHVTIEVNPQPHPIGTSAKGHGFPDRMSYGEYSDPPVNIPKETEQQIFDLAKQFHQQRGGADHHKHFQDAADQILGPLPAVIRQIKGKGNAKPKKDYIPYVQDFVKSGNWSDVNELRNADMHHAGNLYTNNERKNLERLTGEKMDYVAQQDIPKHRELLKQNNVPPLLPEDKADGGSIKMGKGGKVKEPKKTTKAYKLFRVNEKHPGKLFPLFVNANQPVEMGKWVDAEVGPQTETGKVKSKLGPLAYRPGWHSGDLPVATHIGGGGAPPTHRPKNHVWAEVEVPNDVDWQTEADKRGMNKTGKLIARNAHITDQIPIGGHYRYKTNPNMTGNWLISGSMKVNKVLSHPEVERINKKAGVADLPRIEPFNKKEFGFKEGGEVQPLLPKFKE